MWSVRLWVDSGLRSSFVADPKPRNLLARRLVLPCSLRVPTLLLPQPRAAPRPPPPLPYPYPSWPPSLYSSSPSPRPRCRAPPRPLPKRRRRSPPAHPPRPRRRRRSSRALESGANTRAAPPPLGCYAKSRGATPLPGHGRGTGGERREDVGRGPGPGGDGNGFSPAFTAATDPHSPHAARIHLSSRWTSRKLFHDVHDELAAVAPRLAAAPGVASTPCECLQLLQSSCYLQARKGVPHCEHLAWANRVGHERIKWGLRRRRKGGARHGDLAHRPPPSVYSAFQQLRLQRHTLPVCPSASAREQVCAGRSWQRALAGWHRYVPPHSVPGLAPASTIFVMRQLHFSTTRALQ